MDPMDPMDPSDWRVFRRTKNCWIEKMTSRTVVGIGSLIIVNIMGGFGRLGHVSKYVAFSLTSQL